MWVSRRGARACTALGERGRPVPQSLDGRPTATAWSKPVLAVGDFVVLVGETFAAMFRRPFAWRELLDQIWFVARVSIVPTLVLSIPYTC